jgi:hypothetical protein
LDKIRPVGKKCDRDSASRNVVRRSNPVAAAWGVLPDGCVKTGQLETEKERSWKWAKYKRVSRN